ncbi:zinc finger MYM-type protein 1-like [Ischnura elegans]|nr:zinc finger MYM-type protein 1-like [Ischnura elegans]
MLHVCKLHILEEIRSADFVSVIADETTDVSAKAQMVVVFRSVLKSGLPIERFWTFLNPKHHDAETLFACIKRVLVEVLGEAKNKLISQSYDGTNVMSGQFNGVQTRVKAEYPNAHFVHCYAHQLNLVMVQATSQNKEVRVFFANLQEVCTFFSQSSQRADILDEIVGKRLPSGSSTRWNYNSRSVLVVHQNIQELIECFEKIEETSKMTSTLNKAQGLKLKLQQPEFKYWLEFFSKVMPHVDILYSSLQKKNINPVWAKEAISSFKREIQKVRESVESLATADESAEPRPKRNKVENWQTLRNAAAKEVCDAIAAEAERRFEFTGHLVAANLFDNENMSGYRKRFPDDILNTTIESFGFLDKNKLRCELQLIYSREDFKEVKKATHLLSFLLENNLEECFSETVKLLKALITIPMTTAEAERCFSCLKRIKTFLRSTMDEDRLTALTMMSIEKEMARNIVDFNEKVIDHFAAKKERRMDFMFKHTTTAGVA